MISRERWDALQTRWAAGEALSVDEERERLDHASRDPLARRELELFHELSLRVQEPDAPKASANVTAALAAARGVRLRVVAPGTKPRAPAPIRRGRVAAAATLALSGAAAVLALRAHDSEAPAKGAVTSSAAKSTPLTAATARSELVFASGEVWLGEESARIGAGTLSAGASVRTGAGRACLVIDPEIDVCLGANTSVTLESLAPAETRVRVESGTAVAELAPRSPGHRFELAARDVTATAHGTVFALEAGGEATRVAVVEGEVGVTRAGKAEGVLGSLSELRLDGPSAKPRALGRNEESRLRALLGPRPIWQATELGVLEENHDAPRATASVDSVGPFPVPLRALVATGEREVLLRSPGGESALRRVDVVAGSARKLERGDFPAAAERPAPTPRLLLEEARSALSKGDRRGALAAYLRLRRAHPNTPEATTVLVPLGKLELELGSPQKALAAFDAYAKTRGALLPEALSGKIRAYRALGRERDELRTIEDYLRRFPNGFDAVALDKRRRALSDR